MSHSAAAAAHPGGAKNGAGAAAAVVIDSEDHPAWTTAALDAHNLTSGRVTVHPSPGASTPPALAQDILVALGKQLPPHAPGAPRHRACWADMVQPSWTAAACWINALHIGHLIVLRAHILAPTRWAQLDELRRRTGIHLTLIWHAKPDARLRTRADQLGTGHQVIDHLDAARARYTRNGPARPGATLRATDSLHGARSDTLGVIERVQRIGHPLHAALLAAQTILPHTGAEQLAAVRLADLAPDATALALADPPYRPTSPRHWHRAPAWAQPLLVAARAWHYLHSHQHPSRYLFQHINFHHHNQLTDIAAGLGVTPAINILTGDPAWPTPPDPR
ncbi:hypothetical protein [Streptomyces sp. NPDC050145]|uniref:hypothetical protein n=1 Tax=Streptomyces sp. NPDC050145 TaxID=3365602 RepID=UPI0037A0016F